MVTIKDISRQCGVSTSTVSKALNGRLVLLEFGVGFNTPAIIRFPFERLAAGRPNVSLIRFNRDYPQLMIPEVSRFVAFTEDVTDVFRQIYLARKRSACERISSASSK